MNKLIGVVAGMALAVLGAEARAAVPSKAVAVVPASAPVAAETATVVEVADRRGARRVWRGGPRRAGRVWRGGPRVARAWRGGPRAWRGGRAYVRPRYAYRGWRAGPRWRYGWGYRRGWGYGPGWGWGAAGFGVGLATGALIGSAYAAPPAVVVDGPVVVAAQPWTPAWYESCRARYRSFNPATGYYVAYSGRRVFCR